MTANNDKALRDVFPGDSGMSALMRAHDWASTPLGAPEAWPQVLKVTLRMMLTSRFEMWLGWGPDMAFFYNDAYVPTLGVKHPDALARPMREVWGEIFEELSGRFNQVLHDGVATWDKALLLLLERSGFPEETYHTFSYSPLIGDDGAVGGLMCVVTEETERVISERRLDMLRVLTTALVPVRSRDAVVDAARAALETNHRDFPFSVVRFFDGPDGLDGAVMDGETPWPFAKVLQGQPSGRVPLGGLMRDPPRGDWDIPPREALILPIVKPGSRAPSGALVLGLNPYRPWDPEMEGFADLLAGQIASALARVDAHLAEAAETERLRQLFEQSPSFIAVLRGPEHRFELVNPGYLQLIGHRDVVGKITREALPEVVDQGFVELLDTVFTTGQPYVGRGVQANLQRTPGEAPEPRFVDFVYQPIRDPAGVVTGIFVEGIDVTSTHDALVALRASEAQFRILAEAMPNHVWTARPDGYLDWFNQQVYEFSGAVEGSLDGSAWVDIVHGDDAPAAGERWANALVSGDAYEAEFRLRRADGTWRWHIARAVPLRAEDGAISRWIGTNTDIDDQKTTARALVDLNATLEHQVQERTGELMAVEEALRQSQKMDAVGQLTGGIAHDFNNLLTGISGALNLIRKRVNEGRVEEIDRLMEMAQGSVTRAAALTHRLLAFARRQSLDTVPQDVNRLIGGLDDMLRRTLGETVTFETTLGPDLWWASADANQLENALLNLAINARDAMPDGGVLRISTANLTLDQAYAALHDDAEAGDYVEITVSDTGEGMTSDILAKAFDPFFTTKPIGQGTGLGLSMIYGFAKQSGGHVRLFSQPGEGTTVKLFLRRALAPDAETTQSPAAAAPRGQGETVLVVEDDPTVRLLVLEVLDELGYQHLEAADAREAIPFLESGRAIDLMVTDVGLPVMNGRQLAEIARQHRPQLKILFVTGYAEQAALRRAFLEPGMEMMTKPFELDALATKIRELVER